MIINVMTIVLNKLETRYWTHENNTSSTKCDWTEKYVHANYKATIKIKPLSTQLNLGIIIIIWAWFNNIRLYSRKIKYGFNSIE